VLRNLVIKRDEAITEPSAIAIARESEERRDRRPRRDERDGEAVAAEGDAEGEEAVADDTDA
jgi:small subunit ribosomal protein S6